MISGARAEYMELLWPDVEHDSILFTHGAHKSVRRITTRQSATARPGLSSKAASQ